MIKRINISNNLQGVLLALIAVVLWSGNFIISRKVSTQISPVSLAFYRWLTASIVLIPFAWKPFAIEYRIAKKHWKIFFWLSLTGIALFNTFVYIAGHYTSAINMALIGTTSSPIFATAMAVIFLKERLGIYRIAGIFICIMGILLLLSKGSWAVLAAFHFSTGDLWILAGAFSFAIYNVLISKKPSEMSSLSFLFILFTLGTLMLFPFYLIEQNMSGLTHTQWDSVLISSIIYIGLGASVFAFWCWNIAIKKIGTGSTVLFGNLIVVFSTLEAVVLLGEEITTIHILSGVIVIIGLIIANIKTKKY
ncbi:MAG: DMT family transporter [Sphingobacteriia bacterium]|nr:MAG: DMT family transporter [Sphingobacteriia bacterium]TAG31080.1 MAG: DMT family transporter [Sphingobacteriia bacterium]TAH08380.1 MAG: DMT family transporter [Sphingobacteriia bacterium]